MSDNGKGDLQRPLSISLEEWERNYESIDWSNWPPKPETKREERRPSRQRTR